MAGGHRPIFVVEVAIAGFAAAATVRLAAVGGRSSHPATVGSAIGQSASFVKVVLAMAKAVKMPLASSLIVTGVLAH